MPRADDGDTPRSYRRKPLPGKDRTTTNQPPVVGPGEDDCDGTQQEKVP